MPYWNTLDRHEQHETTLLARSLLFEALYGRQQPALVVLQDRPRQRWTRLKMRQAVEGFLCREGRLPSYAEWAHAQHYGLPSRDTVLRHWGSKHALVQAAKQAVAQE